MKSFHTHLFAAYLLSSFVHSALNAAPVDLSPPKNAVGSADGDGYLRYVHRFGDIVFSDNFSIPLRFDFSSRRVVEGARSEFGWHGWNCGAVEATSGIRTDGLLEVQLLCAKIMLLRPVKDTAGAYLSLDGSWKGTVDGDQVSITRNDGWDLRFVGGKVESLRTDKGRMIRWSRDAAGRLIAIQEEGSAEPQLRFSWRDDGTAEEVSIGHQSYRFRFAGGYLSAIDWTLSSGQPRSFSVTQKENSLRIQTSKLSDFRFFWNTKSGVLMADGENRYTLQESRSPGQKEGRRILSMTAPDGSVVAHELGSRSGETRFVAADGREIVVTRVISDTTANGSVDRVEWIREGHPPFVLMKNVFDDEGKIVQRLWLGDPVVRRGFDQGKVAPALLPDRETVFPVDQIDPEAAMTMLHYSYTEIGQLQRVTATDEEVLRFDYDSENRLVLMSVPGRFEKSFIYQEDGAVVENLDLPEEKNGPFWYLESQSAGIGPDLVMSSTVDGDGRLLSRTYADGRSLTVEYDAAMRRVADRIVAADGETEIERIAYVHSPQDGTAMQIRENFLTGGIEYADVSIHAIGRNLHGRKVPAEAAARRAEATNQQ